MELQKHLNLIRGFIALPHVETLYQLQSQKNIKTFFINNKQITTNVKCR